MHQVQAGTKKKVREKLSSPKSCLPSITSTTSTRTPSHVNSRSQPLTGEAATADILKQLESGGKLKLTLSDSDKERIKERLIEELDKNSTREAVIKEIHGLAETIVGIERDFATIKNQVQRVDDKKILLHKDGSHNPFCPRWTSYHDEYTNLMLKSQETATTARNQINTLIHDIVPTMEEVADIADKREIIDDYIAKLKTFEERGMDQETRFLRLKQNIEAFQKDLKDAIAENLAEANEELKKVEARIKTLKEDLEQTGGFWADCIDTLGNAAGIASSANGILQMAPAIVPSFFSAGLSIFGNLFGDFQKKAEERKAKTKELNELVKKKGDLETRIEDLKVAMAEVNALDDFKHLSDRLGALHAIWRMLDSDAQTLRESLEAIDAAINKGNKLYVKMATKGIIVPYKLFASALQTYCLATAPKS
ncbi:hypothetical protein CVT24_010385 [Panaeolus cyanescens]|uniref:Uncharacterized protein n=1 Tax=Panaeolus cyanescens TaxID=181874 RepID=A0A409YQ60_9AGAR|nr:hypothetical protein CVT24_010385 [Panaeolus cyanescens]